MEERGIPKAKEKGKEKSKWKTPTRKEEKKEGRETRWRWDLERFLIKQYENITANCRRQWRKNTKMEAKKWIQNGYEQKRHGQLVLFRNHQKKKTPCLLQKTSQHFEKAKEQKRRFSFFTLTVHWKTWTPWSLLLECPCVSALPT